MTSWYDVPTEIGQNGSGKIDPYIDWAFRLAPDLPQSIIKTGRFPLLLCLREHLRIEKFVSGEFFPDGKPPPGWSEMVRVPVIYLRGDELHRGYFTALVAIAFFRLFQGGGPIAAALFHAISRMAVSRDLLEGTAPVGVIASPREILRAPDLLEGTAPVGVIASPREILRAPSGNCEAGTVVVGIIDDGIAFANERFRTPEGRSRVEYVWLQDGVYNDAAGSYGYGRSLSKRGKGGIDDVLEDVAALSAPIDEGGGGTGA